MDFSIGGVEEGCFAGWCEVLVGLVWGLGAVAVVVPGAKYLYCITLT